MGLYGLVVQRGPWKRSRQDAAQELPNSKRTFGGGIQGGLDHPGHAGAYSAKTPQTMSLEAGYFMVPRPGPYAYPSVIVHDNVQRSKGVPVRKSRLESLETAVRSLTKAIDKSGIHRAPGSGYNQGGGGGGGDGGPAPPAGGDGGGNNLPYAPGYGDHAGELGSEGTIFKDIKVEPTAEDPSADRMDDEAAAAVVAQDNAFTSHPSTAGHTSSATMSSSESATHEHVTAPTTEHQLPPAATSSASIIDYGVRKSVSTPQFSRMPGGYNTNLEEEQKYFGAQPDTSAQAKADLASFSGTLPESSIPKTGNRVVEMLKAQAGASKDQAQKSVEIASAERAALGRSGMAREETEGARM